MSVRVKLMLVVGATLVVLVGALALTLGRVMRSGFARIEESDTRNHVTRVLDAVGARLAGIENTLFTWTQWDPSYRFVEDRNPQFLAENVSSTVFTGMKIDFCVFVDRRGEVVYAGGYDRLRGRDLPVPSELLRLIGAPSSGLLGGTDPTRAARGIAMVGPSPLLVVAAPVTNTAGSAPARGHIVFARFFDDAEVQQIAEITHLRVAVDHVPLGEAGIVVQVRDQETIQGITNLVGLDGQPVLRVVVDVPREVDRQARHSLRLLLLAIVAIGAVFGVVIYAAITRLVLRRVLAVSRTVAAMTETLDFSLRAEVSGRDEISALAASVNGMACAVSEVLALHAEPRSRG